MLHGLGFFYFLISLLGGALVYAFVLGTVIYKYKEFKKDNVFRTAFYKITGIIVFSAVISVGMQQIVIHNVSRMGITIRNMADQKIEKVIIAYPRNNVIEIGALEIGNKEEQVIFPQGEGALTIEVNFTDGSSKEKVLIGYLDQTISNQEHRLYY